MLISNYRVYPIYKHSSVEIYTENIITVATFCTSRIFAYCYSGIATVLPVCSNKPQKKGKIKINHIDAVVAENHNNMCQREFFFKFC